MQLKPLLFASLFAYAYTSTVPDILHDLAALKRNLVALDGAINSFPDSGGTLKEALAINDDSTAVKNAIDATTPDAANVDTPISVDAANEVLAAVRDLQANINSTLTDIVAKKPAFDALPAGGVSDLVRKDLNDLNASNTALGDALIEITPSEVLDEVQKTRNEIGAAFADAITEYAD
ncbi:hypothetical protein AN958_05319 [Leucoagaricus sp. SymC.cos]|nr:hypothetical protein AN958_05319 [Leucoagaricus sp. SymC.cos]